jgi:type I restriction enzyme S subunit
MEEWKEYRLGDFMEFNPKVKLPKNTLARKITMDMLVPHCRDIHHWTFEPYSGGTKFQNGDTIMARITPCLENGKHAYISCLEEGEVAFGSTEYIVIRNREGISDSPFTYYLTHYPEFKDTAIKSMVGTSGRQRAQVDVLENLIMSLPSLEEQSKIASILSSLDDKIEVNRKINENLEAQAQALFKSWFVDFEPFRDGEFVESELGMIPKGWRIGKVGELCVTNKRSYGSSFTFPIEYIDTGSVTANRIETIQLLDPEIDKIPCRARRAIQEGDILYSSVRPNQRHFAFMYAPKSNMVASTGFIVITASWSGYRYYIYQYLIQDDVTKRLQAIAEQTVSTYPSINASDITNLDIVVPPNFVIEKYADLANIIIRKLDNNQQESRRLAELRDTLLPKLMSGDLKVNFR